MPTKTIEIEQLGYIGGPAGKEITRQINRLLAQLSGNIKTCSLRELQEVTLSDSNHVYIAIADSTQIVGMVTLVVVRQFAGVKGWIEDVVVDKDHRGLGIAKQLMQQAMDDAPIEVKSINLTSKRERTEAHQLYYGLGFEKRDTDAFRFTPDF